MEAPAPSAVDSVESNGDSTETEAIPVHVQILAKPDVVQDGCPFFKAIPAETRNQIFALALGDFPDPDHDQSGNGLFRRCRSDARLVRTCRAIYRETWALPLLLREHMYWLATHDSHPYIPCPRMWPYRQGSRLYDQDSEFDAENTRHRQRLIETFARFDPKHNNNRVVEIPCLQVFASTKSLDNGHLDYLLRTPHLNPRKLVITIPLFSGSWRKPVRLALHETALSGQWICKLRKFLSQSVREIVIRLETFDGRQFQLDSVVNQMREKWFFRRTGPRGLYTDFTKEVDTATRSEVGLWTHDTHTWIQHAVVDPRKVFGSHLACVQENDYCGLLRQFFRCTHLVEMKFYSATVRFQLVEDIIRQEGRISPSVIKFARTKNFYRKELSRGTEDGQLTLTMPGNVDSGPAIDSLAVTSDGANDTSTTNDTTTDE